MTKQRTDEQLAQEIQAGERELFGDIIDRYEAKLTRYVRYLIPDDGIDPDDIVQEVFINAFTNMQAFSTNQKFSSWIYRIAHNKAIDIAKKRGRQKSTDIHALEDKLHSDHDIAEEVSKDEVKQQLHQALSKLPLKYKDVLVLFYFEEKSYNDIVDIMQVPLKTVGTLIHRGKKALRIVCEQQGVHHA